MREIVMLLVVAFGLGQSDTLPLKVTGLVPVPKPDLTQFELVVQTQLGQVEAGLQGTDDPTQLSLYLGEAGRHYHAYQLMASAKACYQNAILLDPNNAKWVYLLASLYRQEGLFDLARHYFVESLQLAPDYTSAWIQLGDISMEQGKIDDAEAVFKRALELDPEAVAAEVGLGRVAMEQDRPKDAIALFERALAQVPRADRLHYLIGTAYRAMGDREQANRHLAQAGRIGVRTPDPVLDALRELVISVSGYMTEGKKAFGAGDYDSAIQFFTKVIEIDNTNAEAHVNLGSALTLANRSDEAFKVFLAATELNNPPAELFYNLGFLFAQKGDFSSAEKQFKTVLNMEPTDQAAALLLGQVLEAQQKTDEAKSHYRIQMEAFPTNLDITFRLGFLLLQDDDFAGFSQLIASLSDESLRTHMDLAHLAARFWATSPDESLRDGARAVATMRWVLTQSQAPKALESMALACAVTGECDLAIIWIKKAIAAVDEQDPLSQRFRLVLRQFQATNCQQGG
ncbi:MAG: tetratricopeptide repeat protein [Acidobacteria bacterium]|nr:tetratricopeptide repeat protein [Acidobacteriota bacterium]